MADVNRLLAMTYGPPGCGKTVGTTRGFSNAVMIGPPNCFLSTMNFLKFTPRLIQTVRRITDVTEVLEKLADKASVDSVVISDLSLLAAEEETWIRKSKKDGGDGVSGWDVFTLIAERVNYMNDVARDCKFHVIQEWHEQEPKNVQKVSKTGSTVQTEVFIPGCPAVPGWQLPKMLPARYDLVAYIKECPDLLSARVWPYGYSSKPDGRNIAKDRTDSFPAEFPLNLREALRLSGVIVPRHKDIVWMDSPIDDLANELVENQRAEGTLTKEKTAELLKKTATKLKSYDNKHVRWVILDAFDRASLIDYNDKLLDNLITNLTDGLKGD